MTLKAVVDFFLGLGASVLLPIIIFFLSISFGAKAGKSLRSAIMIGVGFVGIGLVIGLLMNNLGPAAKSMVDRFHIPLDIIDVGWPAAASIAFGSKVATLIIPVGIFINLILLFTRVTKTINIDIWNFWHFAFVGAIVNWITGSLWYGLLSAVIFAAIMLFFADWTAPSVQQLMKIPGISLPHGFSTTFVLPAIILNAILEKIPGVRNWKADPESIKKKFGVFGEPVIIGLVIGFIIGMIGYAGIGKWTEWVKKVLTLSVSMAAVMVLMPRMVALLMEGLIPISEAAREFLQKRAKGKEIYIGLDSAIAIGHPTSIATALLMVPITLLLAVILPGNKVLPFGDLATIPFMVCMMVPIVRGNVVRATIIATIIMIPTLYIMNYLSPAVTAAAHAANFNFPKGTTNICSICDGGNWLSFVFSLAAKKFWIGNLIIVVLLVIAWSFFKRSPEKWYKAAGYLKED